MCCGQGEGKTGDVLRSGGRQYWLCAAVKVKAKLVMCCGQGEDKMVMYCGQGEGKTGDVLRSR